MTDRRWTGHFFPCSDDEPMAAQTWRIGGVSIDDWFGAEHAMDETATRRPLLAVLLCLAALSASVDARSDKIGKSKSNLSSRLAAIAATRPRRPRHARSITWQECFHFNWKGPNGKWTGRPIVNNVFKRWKSVFSKQAILSMGSGWGGAFLQCFFHLWH